MSMMGVDPGDQDVVLEDADWTEIIAALEGAARIDAAHGALPAC